MDSKEFDKSYYIGATKSSYSDYATCKGVLNAWAEMVNITFSPTSIFDGGCAYGFLPEWFASKGIDASGCDLSEFASGRSALCYQASLDNIPEPDSKWDVVVSSEVLEHIPEPLVDKVLSELYRICGSRLVLLIGIFPEGTLSDPNDSTHITLHPFEWWEEKIAKLGTRDLVKEEELSSNHYSRFMNWSGRFFVVNKE